MTYNFERTEVGGDSSYIFLTIDSMDDADTGINFKTEDNFSPREVEELAKVANLDLQNGLTGLVTSTLNYEICNFSFYLGHINIMLKVRK